MTSTFEVVSSFITRGAGVGLGVGAGAEDVEAEEEALDDCCAEEPWVLTAPLGDCAG